MLRKSRPLISFLMSQASPEEVLGLINGLAGVVKNNQILQNEASKAAAEQLSVLSKAVADLSQTVAALKPPSSSTASRLPNLSLPNFTGKEDLDRFAEQLTAVLHSSGVPPFQWLPYLKQQVAKDAYAYDIICSQESKSSCPSLDASADDHRQWFEVCLRVLLDQRGVPRDQPIHQLLSTYYTMAQGQAETVADFANRFQETQHALEKLVPGIHRPAAGDDLELMHAFAIKLKTEISTELLSRDFAFPSLAALIEAGKRYELRVPLVVELQKNFVEWQPEAHFSAPQKTNTNVAEKLCRNFNKFDTVHCELPNGLCSKGFIHRCTICRKFNCKAKFHSNRKSDSPAQNKSYRFTSSRRIRYNNLPNHHVANVATTSSDSRQNVEEPQRSPSTMTASSQQDHLFGLPAIASPPPALVVSGVDLAAKTILWTRVVSAGVSLPLPIDSGCSVSLVSQAHADTVAKDCPHLKFNKLEQPFSISVANPSASLQAVGVMQVPIVWENGRSSTFSMLVVPNLAWPILFGNNHLIATEACMFPSQHRVFFNHSSMQFNVKCESSNPLKAFPNLGFSSRSHGSSTQLRCLLTAMPSPSRSYEPPILRTGFNLIPVCLLLTASSLGTALFTQPLWLEGSCLASGISILSGPISFSRIAILMDSDSPLPTFTPSANATAFWQHSPVPTLAVSPETIASSETNDLPSPEFPFYANVIVHSTRDNFCVHKQQETKPYLRTLLPLRPRVSLMNVFSMQHVSLSLRQLSYCDFPSC